MSLRRTSDQGQLRPAVPMPKIGTHIFFFSKETFLRFACFTACLLKGGISTERSKHKLVLHPPPPHQCFLTNCLQCQLVVPSMTPIRLLGLECIDLDDFCTFTLAGQWCMLILRDTSSRLNYCKFSAERHLALWDNLLIFSSQRDGDQMLLDKKRQKEEKQSLECFCFVRENLQNLEMTLISCKKPLHMYPRSLDVCKS